MFDRASSTLSDLLDHLRRSDYTFTTVTPATHARVLKRSSRGTTLRDAFGWTRSCPLDLLPVAMFDRLRSDQLLTIEDDHWRSHLRASSLDGLLLLHSAYPTIEEDAVFFGPDTYRFVASIRRWMEAHRPAARVADIGCGSGAAGLFIARAWPQSQVTLLDINDRALTLAHTNAAHAGLTNVEFRHSNLLHGVDGEFDLIVANPPYMADPLKRNYRDGGGQHGCDLSLRIVHEAMQRLSPGGTLLLYTGAPVVDGTNVFLAELTPLMSEQREVFQFEELDPDVFGEELDTPSYADAERIAAVLLTFRKAPR